MGRRLILDSRIPDDLIDALDYYDRISPDLANRFRHAVNKRLDEIAEAPEPFAFDFPPVCFARLKQFPYVVFFVAKLMFVSVIAILHGSSDPSRWRGRTK